MTKGVRHGLQRNVPGNTTGLLECNIFGKTFLLICNNEVAMELAKHSVPTRFNDLVCIESPFIAWQSMECSVPRGEEWRKEQRILSPPLNQKKSQGLLAPNSDGHEATGGQVARRNDVLV